MSSFSARILALLLFVAGAILPGGAQPAPEGTSPDGQVQVRFKYKPGHEVTRVDVCGDFNGWVQSPATMSDADGDGTYEVLIPLTPGPHEYKFVIDGQEWLTDPANPNIGDHENSIVQVPTPEGYKPTAQPPPSAPPPPVDELVLHRPSTQWSGPLWPWGLAGLLLGVAAVTARRRGRLGEGAPCSSRFYFAMAAALLTILVRTPLVLSVGEELDELDYLPITQRYVGAMMRHDVGPLVNEPTIREHPRLGFVLQAATAVASGTGTDYLRVRTAARFSCVLLAGLVAALLAWRWPLAAVLWAFAGISVKYTSIAYLDSSVAAFGVLCVLGFSAAWRRGGPAAGWPNGRGAVAMLLISAFGAGATVASKYLGAVAPISVALGFGLIAVGARGKGLPRLAGIFAAYVAVALAAMMICDPSLWHGAPWRTIAERVMFHRNFSHSDVVVSSNFPWYQPVMWVWNFTALTTDPTIGWTLLDRLVAATAAVGVLAVLPRKDPAVALAAGTTLVFLLLWPTKWPQYETALMPWVCVGAEALVVAAVQLFRAALLDRGAPSEHLAAE